MTIANEKEKVIEGEDLEEDPSIDEKISHDITDALRVTGHFTTRYPNGLTLGVRMESVPGTRGVHVDVVYVLDLREASFGKSGLAMRAAVLESINRSLSRVMGDVGLEELMQDQSVLTPWGRVRLPLLKGAIGKSASLIHETRTVYVITEGTKPTMDLSWLTDSGRVVTSEEFVLIRRSDARSRLPNLKKSVTATKWGLLENGLTRGWFGVLALASLVIAVSTALSVLILGTGSLILPLIASAFSGAIGGWLLQSSRSSINGFVATVSGEQELLDRIGDAERISQSIINNEDKLILIGDLNFVVSPLIAAAGRSLEEGDVDAAVSSACAVLDECVRLAPIESSSNSVFMESADEGLRKFLGLFEDLGGVEKEESLALAYVALTGHVTKSIRFGEVVTHLTELNNALYNVGALRPDIKDGIDDHLNKRAMKQAVEEIDKDLAKEETISFDKIVDEIENPEDLKTVEAENPTEVNLNDMIRGASVDESLNHEDSSVPEMDLTAADIVSGSKKKRKKKKDTKQLSLLDDLELGDTTSGASEESESASV
ncbi:MAG: hypothetical protein ACW98U_13360 [Candidatus Thorarchaeota archaeon]|jgi:hypothetical protein